MRWSWMIAAALLATSFAATAGGKIYRWVDASGEIHYAGVAPTGVKATLVKVYGNAEDGGTQAKAQSTAPSAPKNELPDAGTGQNGLTTKQEAAIKQNCKYARRNLATFQNPSIRRFLGPDGKVHRYTEEQRKQKIKETQDYIKQYCNTAAD